MIDGVSVLKNWVHWVRFGTILAFLFPLVSLAQDRTTVSDWRTSPNIIIETFDQDDGLPVVSLSDIEIGADNYLYVASYSGLSRFDGTTFELITSEQFPQLRSNRILRLLASPDSSIWMFDDRYNLSRWKAGEITVYDTLNGTGDRAWADFNISESGSIWAINNKKIRIFEPNTQSWGLKPPLPFSVSDFVPLTDSTAYVINKEGIYIYDEGYIKTIVAPAALPFDQSDTSIQLKLLSNNKLLAYNYAHLLVYDITSQQSQTYSINKVEGTAKISVFEIEPDQLFISTYSDYYELDLNSSVLHKIPSTDGFNVDYAEFNPIWNGERIYVSSDKIKYRDEIIFSVGTNLRIIQTLQDKEGNLWVSTSGQGLKRITVNPFRVLESSHGLGGLNAYSIIEDKDQAVWIGTFDSGVNRVTNNRVDFWYGPNLPNGKSLVRSMFEQNNGNILTGIWDWGVKSYDGISWSELQLTDNTNNKLLKTVESYYEEPDGTLWLGGRKGLIKKTTSDEHFERVLSDRNYRVQRIQVIESDYKNRLWFGTNGHGLQVFRKNTLNRVPLLSDESNLSIRDIYTARRDTLWLATQNHGLIRALLDADGNIKSYKSLSKADGLPDIGVHRILRDHYGYFWLPSNQGLSRVNEQALNAHLDNPTTNKLWIQTLTEDDGLPIREGNGGTQSSGMVASDSTIWIPTQRGVVHFDPAYFLDWNPYKFTEINVSSVETEDMSYPLYGNNSVQLNLGERTLNMTFSILHFSNPQNISIEYRIKSLQTGWQKLTDNRQINFTSITPGKHVIETRIPGIPESTYDGQSFTLVVPTFFYEEIWFFVLLGLGAITIISFSFIFTIRVANRREQVLNEKVEERTLLLKEQASELERLNQVKTDFFINITHELRTPLTLIKGPLSLLKNASNRVHINQKLQLELIDRNSERLMDLVDRLLNLLRLETEQDIETIEKIDLRDYVRHQASQYESSEGLEGKLFDIHLQGIKTFVYADPHTLELIINNLISNAIKYTQKGDSIQVRVYLANQNVVFEIEDSGIGIAKEDLRFIFDPFYRAGNVDDIGGSGVGLSIVKRYMDKIGGEIKVISEKNHGTKVSLIFPKNIPLFPSQSKSDVLTENIVSETIPNFEQVSSKRNKILVVEDNSDLQIFFSELLGHFYDITTANNGEHALKLLNQFTPDLILSDVMMPKMDGISLVKNIRSSKKLEMVPMILLSAKKTNESITEGLKAGAHVYLTKPIENGVLLAQIDALISREKRLSVSGKQTTPNYDQAFFNKVHELIIRHLSDPTLSVDSIAEALHISRSTLYRKWKLVNEQNLNDYIVQIRLEETVNLIKEKGYTFSQASRVCGFLKPGYFSTVFKKHYCMTPSEYFKSNKN